ncbi:MAG: hypothetical protein IPI75_15910 [Gammaproteobacteria bacterium]|nr:hypothetical protein [Gammaproteobacteria bacterium]
MKKYLLAAILLAPLMTPIAFAECSKEAAPAIPDGASATEQEMIAGQQAVKSYIASSNASLECLDAEGVAAGADELPEFKDARLSIYNAAVDEMTGVGDQFNAAVKAFKAR